MMNRAAFDHKWESGTLAWYSLLDEIETRRRAPTIVNGTAPPRLTAYSKRRPREISLSRKRDF